MGLLESVIGALSQAQQGQQGGSGLGGLGGQGQGDLLGAVLSMLGNDSPLGGLAGLAARFQQGGLSEVLQSWIATGQNQPVSGDQLHEVLGGDAIGALARQLGLSPGDAAGQLSQVLPQLIDHLTPHGQAPEGGLGDVGDLLGALLRR